MNSINLLEQLSNSFGVSGYEDPVRETINELVSPYVDEIRVDELGNLIATKNGQGSSTLMLDAHMDEVGFMINHVDEDGFLRFTNLGGWDPRILPSHTVTIMVEDRKNITGVIGTTPPHIQSEEDRQETIDWDDLFIDIGADSQSEVTDRGVGVGSFATIDYPFEVMGDDYVKGKAFDDRVGCATAIQSLENLTDQQIESTLVVNFAICEETGLRGARTAAYQLDPDLAIALEGTIGADIPSVPAEKQPVKLGEGPAYTVADNSIVVKKSVISALEKTAENNNIPYQYKKPTFGGTDAGPIHLTKEGVLAGVVSTPCRYIHSPHSTMKLSDFEYTVQLVTEFVRTYPDVLSI